MLQRLVLIGALILFMFLTGSVVEHTSAILNLKSGVLVLGGTLISIFLAFPIRTIMDVISGLVVAFRHKETDYQDLVRQMEMLAWLGRFKGNRALEEEGNKAENPFLRKGIELVVDGYDRFEIRNIMEKEYELYFSRKESQVSILNTLAKLSPVFGFLGTIIGLINVLANMSQPTEIGKGMAVALLTTFYGLLFSNFLFLPLCKKLSAHIKEEATLLNLILEGVMDISDNKNSKAVSYRLQSYLSVDGLNRADALEPAPNVKRPISQISLWKLITGR